MQTENVSEKVEFQATANSWALNKLKDQLTEMFLIGVIQLNPKSGKSTATSLTLPLTTVVESLGDTDGLKWTNYWYCDCFSQTGLQLSFL